MAMKEQQAANCLSELGNLTRLAIFRYLVKVGPAGAPVGAIQAELDIPASTLSHHLSRLVRVGLVRQDRASRTLYCKPQFELLDEMIEFLKSECCSVTPLNTGKKG
jgi:DNA-binding transcriptional ArsR family regulator